jgi:hypothetical protein
VLLGHLTAGKTLGGLPFAMIGIGAGDDGELSPEQILERYATEQCKAWGPPAPVVVLAACESAADDPRSLASFLSAFAKCGASAVVGTETEVFLDFATEFSAALVGEMFSGPPNGPKALGAAVLKVRRQLLERNNPLGFVFTVYGNADLIVGAA